MAFIGISGVAQDQVYEKRKGSFYVAPTGEGVAEKLCGDCTGDDGIYHWSADGDKILYEPRAADGAIGLFEVSSGEKVELLRHPDYPVYDARFSPHGRWVAFQALLGAPRRQVFIAPFRGAEAIPHTEWIAITDGSRLDMSTWWSPNGNLLYFISDRDGFRCIWAQPLDAATKRPVKSAFAVHHLHETGRSMAGRGGQHKLSVAGDRLVFTLEELAGNIWMMENISE